MNTLSYALASAAGLNYDAQTAACSGSVGGYKISAICINPSQTYGVSRDRTTVILYFSVVAKGKPLSDGLFTDLVNSSNCIKSVQIEDNMLRITCNSKNKSEKETAQIAAAAIEEAVDFFRRNDLSPCCSGCGFTDIETESYAVGKHHACLCRECAAEKYTQLQEKVPERKVWNKLLGLLGAILFSSIGIAIMLLLRNIMFDYFSMMLVGAAVLGACAAIGYIRFGKGVTKKEIPILIVILLILVWLTYQASYAIDAYKYWETDFWETYRYILGVLPSEYLYETGEYWGLLAGNIVVSCVAEILFVTIFICKEKDSKMMYKL